MPTDCTLAASDEIHARDRCAKVYGSSTDAAERVSPTLGLLGARWRGGGDGPTLRPVHVRDAMPVKVMRRDKILAVLSTCVRSKLVTTGTATNLRAPYVHLTFTDGLAHGVLE